MHLSLYLSSAPDLSPRILSRFLFSSLLPLVFIPSSPSLSFSYVWHLEASILSILPLSVFLFYPHRPYPFTLSFTCPNDNLFTTSLCLSAILTFSPTHARREKDDHEGVCHPAETSNYASVSLPTASKLPIQTL